MRIISVCSENHSHGNESRGQNINFFDNLQEKMCEKHLTFIVNSGRNQRSMLSRGVRNIDRNDRSLNSTTPGNTIRSLQSCEDNKSLPDVTSNVVSISSCNKKKRIRQRLIQGLCMAGWIVCCPCWAVGFILREPPETEADLDADPCWPCSSS